MVAILVITVPELRTLALHLNHDCNIFEHIGIDEFER